MIPEEKNTDINNKETWKQPNAKVAASIPMDLWKLAKENGIGWSYALEFGIQFLVAEKTDEKAIEYPVAMKLNNKMRVMRDLIEELSQKNNNDNKKTKK